MGGREVGKRIQSTADVQKKKKTPHCHMKGKSIEKTYLLVVLNTYFGMCYFYVYKTYFVS